MNFELFIAKRIISAKKGKGTISGPIIRLAISAIALGLIIMFIAITTGTGLQQKIRNKVIGFAGHIQVINLDANQSYEPKPIDKNQDFYPSITDTEGIKHIQPYATKVGIVQTPSGNEGLVFKGVDQTYNWDFFNNALIEGTIPAFNDSTRSDSILISKKIANNLKLKLNDKLQMLFIQPNPKPPKRRRFYISGIYETGLEEFDETFLIGHLKHIQLLNKWDENQIGGFEIIIDDYERMTELSDYVLGEIPYSLTSISVRKKYPQIFEWLDLFDINILIILIIMVAVASVNMITALLVLILERTQMIGIMKALGTNNISIRKVFIYNAIYLIGLGLLWGNLIGIGFAYLQDAYGIIKLPAENYYVSEVPININGWHILFLNLGTLAITSIMLIIPSLLITRISPIKAIRFD